MAFDPKLRAAMKEIEAVCEKYDCGGIVSLTSKTHGEFRYVLPKWAGIRLIRDKGDGKFAWHVRVHAKSKPEEANLTMHFIYSTMDVCGNMFMGLQKAREIVENRMKVEHVPFSDFEPFDGDDSA